MLAIENSNSIILFVTMFHVTFFGVCQCSPNLKSGTKTAEPNNIETEICLKDNVVKAANCKVFSPYTNASGTPNVPKFIAEKNNTTRSQAPCYCHVSVCGQNSIPNVFQSCKSGYVHPTNCGGCVKCAKDEGESCGGLSSLEGICKVGLVCEAKDTFSDVGVCVADRMSIKEPDKVYLRSKSSLESKLLVKECSNHVFIKNKETDVDQIENDIEIGIQDEDSKNPSSNIGKGTRAKYAYHSIVNDSNQTSINNSYANSTDTDGTRNIDNGENYEFTSLGELLLGEKYKLWFSIEKSRNDYISSEKDLDATFPQGLKPAGYLNDIENKSPGRRYPTKQFSPYRKIPVAESTSGKKYSRKTQYPGASLIQPKENSNQLQVQPKKSLLIGKLIKQFDHVPLAREIPVVTEKRNGMILDQDVQIGV